MATAASASAFGTRTAIITGATRGIGSAIAQALAASHTLVLIGRDAEALRKAAPGAAHTIAVDLSDRAGRAQLIGTLLELDPAPAVLVNNAGVAPSAPLHQTDAETWARTLEVNLTAPFELCQAVLPAMMRAGFGRIVNIASTSALKGYRYTSAYSASKGGLVALTRALAAEVAGSGVTVNAVCPGFTDTDIVADAVRNIREKTGRTEQDARQALERFSPLRRLIEPREVADLVRYLCSDAAAAIHGQALAIDGGELVL